jgi:hypothetical protein
VWWLVLVLAAITVDGAGPTVMDQLRLVHFFAQVLHAGEVD